MMYYILKRNIHLFFAVLLVSLANLILIQYNEELASIGLAMLMIAGVVGVKTNWYLLLPMSRKRLMAWNVFEAFIITVISSLIIFSMLSLAQRLLNLKVSSNTFQFAFFIFGFVFFLRSMIAINNMNISRVNAQPQQFKISRRIFIFTCVAVGFLALMKVPLFSWLAILCLGLCLPLISYSIFIPPVDSWRKIRNWSAAVCSFAILISLAQVYAEVNYLTPGSMTAATLRSLGNLPLSVTHDRAVVLLKSSDVDASSFTFRLIENYGDSLSKDDIKIRTESCKNRSCIEMSTLLYSMNSKCLEPDFDTFKIIVEKCALKEGKGKLSCSNIKPNKDVWSYWLEKLSKSDQLNAWLKSGGRDQQFFALRAISAKEANQDQLTTIGKLAKSDDPIIGKSAMEYLKVSRPRIELNKEMCINNSQDPSCRINVEDLM